MLTRWGRSEVLKVDTPLRLNAAACYLKMERYSEAETVVAVVLERDKDNVKALFRRSRARACRGDLDAAKWVSSGVGSGPVTHRREDCDHGLKIEPTNADLVRLRREIKQLEKQREEERRKVWGGKLAAPAPDPDAGFGDNPTGAPQAAAEEAETEGKDDGKDPKPAPPLPPPTLPKPGFLGNIIGWISAGTYSVFSRLV